MRIDTPTAKVAVLGTVLSMEAEPASAILHVSEGQGQIHQ